MPQCSLEDAGLNTINIKYKSLNESIVRNVMKLLSYQRNGRAGFGAIKNNKVVDLAARMPGIQSLRDLLIVDKLEKAREVLAQADADYEQSEIVFEPLIPSAEKLICIADNYANEHSKREVGVKTYPGYFLRTHQSVTGHMQDIIRPSGFEQLDYEGEVVIVIGKEGARIAEEDALDYIAGLALANEGMVRNHQTENAASITPAKNSERCGSIGPWMVTADKFTDYDQLQLRTYVNGEIRQGDSIANLKFSFAELIAYVSIYIHLQPGDLILTGTPAGCGVHQTPPQWLAPGDELIVEVPGIGRLVNGVADEVMS